MTRGPGGRRRKPRPRCAAVRPTRRWSRWLSDEHFWVDGTLIEAWASMKSLQPKAEASGAEPPAGEAGSGGTGQKPPAKAATPRWTSMARSARTKLIGPLPIPTHASTARAKARKPGSAIWAHALMENRNGLVGEACLTKADGHAERKRGARDDRAPGVNGCDLDHLGLTSCQVEGAMNIDALTSAGLLNRQLVLLGRQQPTSPAAWVARPRCRPRNSRVFHSSR